MQYVRSLCLADGTTLRLRPIRLEDEPLMVKFHESLSDVSVRRRYFQLTKLCQRIRHERLVQQCFNDFDREVALVAEVQSPKTGERSIWGVGRLSRIPGQSEAEFAVIVGDPWQGRGIGTHLLQSLLQVARDEGIRRIVGRILPDNWSMQLVCKRLGFSVTADPIGGGSKAEIMVGSP